MESGANRASHNSLNTMVQVTSGIIYANMTFYNNE